MRLVKILLIRLLGAHRIALKNGLNEGKGVTIMGGVNYGSEPYLITLDDYVRISFGVSFITHDGATWAFRDLPEYQDIIKYGTIHIGERTFVGCNSIIMPGVSIGKRCIVAAGSVVTKNVPDETVVAGVPAIPIMTTMEYAEKCRKLQKPYDIDAYKEDKRSFLINWLT